MKNFLTRKNGDGWGLSLFDEFDDFFRPVFFNNGSNLMRTDIQETDGSYEFSVDLPGFEKSDIKLQLENGYLTISARTEEKSSDKQNYLRRERACSCSRSFYVGEGVLTEDVKAKYDGGILAISIPKKDKEELKSKNIEIE